MVFFGESETGMQLVCSRPEQRIAVNTNRVPVSVLVQLGPGIHRGGQVGVIPVPVRLRGQTPRAPLPILLKLPKELTASPYLFVRKVRYGVPGTQEG